MIYSVKRFSSDEEKKGMGTGTKLALGAAGLAAAFGGAKAGWMGAGLQRSTNKLWGNVGQALGSRGMMNSGYRGVAKANYKSAARDIAKQNNISVSDLTKKQQLQAGRDAASKTSESFSKDFLTARDTANKTARNEIREGFAKTAAENTAKN